MGDLSTVAMRGFARARRMAGLGDDLAVAAVVDVWADLLDAERARTVVLTDALQQIEKADIDERWHAGPGIGSYGGGETHAGFARRLQGIARAALAVLPVDRVGVEPLDVAPDHEHYWVDAPDDETGWHCTICGLTEYPGMKDELTPNEFQEPGTHLIESPTEGETP